MSSTHIVAVPAEALAKVWRAWQTVPRAGIEQPRVSWADRRRLLMPRALEASRTRAYRVHQFTSTFTNQNIQVPARCSCDRRALSRVCRSVYPEIFLSRLRKL